MKATNFEITQGEILQWSGAKLLVQGPLTGHLMWPLQLNDSVGFFVVLFSLALISCPEQYVSRFWRTRNDDSFPLFPLLHCFIWTWLKTLILLLNGLWMNTWEERSKEVRKEIRSRIMDSWTSESETGIYPFNFRPNTVWVFNNHFQGNFVKVVIILWLIN